jgi:hypothetical protein
MNPRVKRVVAAHSSKKLLPRVLPPIDRPETPRDDRSTASAHTTKLANLSVTSLSSENSPQSPLQNAYDLLSASQTPEDFAQAVQAFHDSASEISERGSLSSADILCYHQIYPLLSKLLSSKPGEGLIVIVKALRYLLSAAVPKGMQPRAPAGASPRRALRMHRFVPLSPLKEENSTCEHFQEFIAKVLYKMSASKDNDPYFADDSMIAELIAMTRQGHKIGTRTYSAAVLRNETHSPGFRARLVEAATFPDVLNTLALSAEKVDFFVQVTGLIRNLIADGPILNFFVGQRVHLLLFAAIDTFSSSPELAFNAFRILTKLSDRPSVREDLLEKFTASGIVTRFLQLLDMHRGNLQIVSRISYVFAEFAARESSVLVAAANLTDPISIALIPDLLTVDRVQADRGVAALLVQVIANLSVDSICSSVLAASDFVSRIMPGCNFGSEDRFGFNLLCCASNFTFHNRSWAPPELIDAIPVALVSKHIPSILEALRTLCNLALEPPARLVSSKIPEMLVILVKHIHPDVVLFSLQTLANLVNHPGIRDRLRRGNLLAVILELFDSEEMEEMELEAIAALVMNLAEMSPGEAASLAKALDQFDIDSGNTVIDAFVSFLSP